LADYDRVLKPREDERNYNIFYEIINNKELKEKFKTKKSKDYKILNEIEQLFGVDDEENYQKLIVKLKLI
jgi:myosin heavy subunit